MKPNLIRYLFALLLGLLFFANANLLAAECRVLQLQKTHHSGINVSNNHCQSNTALSLESMIEIQGGTRLWLETGVSQTVDNFQIICQNQSEAPVKLKLTSSSLPWLVPIDFPHCNNWASNRLLCNVAGQTDPALLCVIAKKPSAKPEDETQLKTSLLMRQTTSKLPTKTDEAQQWADLVKPSIDLCRKLVNSRRTITISWRLNTSGLVNAKSLTQPLALPVDQQFADCALEAIENTHFPKVLKDITLTSMF